MIWCDATQKSMIKKWFKKRFLHWMTEPKSNTILLLLRETREMEEATKIHKIEYLFGIRDKWGHALGGEGVPAERDGPYKYQQGKFKALAIS